MFLAIAGVVAVAAWYLKPDPKPGPLGLDQGALRPCPESPNCVCSLASDGHAVAAFQLAVPWVDARGKIVSALSGMTGFKVVKVEDDYLHLECRTLLMRYVDDLELHWDAKAGLLHVRSASRVGYSDLGANRKRVEAVRSNFRAAGWLKP